jgi:hypothetical protein
MGLLLAKYIGCAWIKCLLLAGTPFPVNGIKEFFTIVGND